MREVLASAGEMKESLKVSWLVIAVGRGKGVREEGKRVCYCGTVG